jgi:hypothetical protein
MSALEKTENLLRLRRCPLSLMVKNDRNPNKMKPREFDLLCDNFNRTGWTDPVLAWPSDMKALEKIVAKSGDDEAKIVAAMAKAGITIKIVGGHHRYDAGAFLGFEAGPATVMMDPEFDTEQEQFQLVRMNTIHGRLDPQAFIDLYNDLSKKYTDEILQDAFGFAEEAEFKKLITQMAKALPDQAMQAQFKEAAKEIKTIDGLSKLLNEMFTKYGKSLPCGFMVFTDEDNKRSMWLRVSDKTMKALDLIGDICIEKNRTVDAILGAVVQLIAKGELADVLAKAVKASPPVEMPPGLQVAPTEENLKKLAEVA